MGLRRNGGRLICKHTQLSSLVFYSNAEERKILAVQMTELCKFLPGILQPPAHRCHLFSSAWQRRNGLRLSDIFVFNLESEAYERVCAATEMNNKQMHTHEHTHFTHHHLAVFIWLLNASSGFFHRSCRGHRLNTNTTILKQTFSFSA